MRIERRFTEKGQSPYAEIEFRTTTSEIKNPDGSIVFQLRNIEVPADWSQVACDVLAQKYFRKAGVPARLKCVREGDIPEWLCRHIPDEEALAELTPEQRTVGETKATQVFDRLAGTWTYWGWRGGYFDGEEDASAFFDELRYMFARQMGAPNSPQWFNTGLHWAYGIDGPAQGHYYVDFLTGKLVASKSAYEHPQPHACFIQSVADDLVNEGGIMDLWVREARLFKYGSGTGSNFSKLRGEGERLSGGGKSSGLMSFLKIGDRAAGAIKSGGTTRRAAKMVTVDLDHPDIEQFIDWKVREEQKVASLVAGSKLCNKHLNADHPGLPCPQRRRGPLRSQGQPRAEEGGEGRARMHDPRELHPAGDRVRAPGLHADRLQDLRHRLGFRRLPDRLRPELQQLRAHHQRLHQGGAGERRLEADPPHRRQGPRDPEGARPLGEDRRGRLAVRRSRRAVRHHHQRVAHLPGERPHQRLQSVLGIHVPGRHGLQPGVAEPDAVPQG